MEYLALIGTVTAVHLLAVISPGPDFFMTVKNSLSYSRKTGVLTAFGFSLGIFFHFLYCVTGLAFLISQSIFIFNIVKALGAGYLIFIGIKSLLQKPTKIKVKDAQEKKDISSWRAVKIGFLTNILNPKTTLFFLSLFTLVISPETPYFILIILGTIMIVNTFIWFSLVAIFFTQKRIRNTFNTFQGTFNKVLGGLFIGLGIKIGLTQK